MLRRIIEHGSEPRAGRTLAGTDELGFGGAMLGIGASEDSITILVGRD